MSNPQHRNRCKALTKAGKPCRAFATEGGLCFFHGNPNKPSELGRIGGRRNRHVFADAVDPLPTADTALAVLNNATQIINDVYTGKVHPKIALSLERLLSLKLRAIEILELEWCAERARKQSAEAQQEGPMRGNGVAPVLNSGSLPGRVGNVEAEDGSSRTDNPTDSDSEESA